MDELISRQAALDGLMLCDFAQDSRQYGGATVLFESSVRKMLEQIPAAQKPGEWKVSVMPSGTMNYCSECGFGQYRADRRTYHYCPNCGTKMYGWDYDD